MSSPPGLLVSVRSVAEAEVALAGGAAIIDVKEPARGPLGRADDAVIAEIVRSVGGRRPVSAALGELAEMTALDVPRGLTFIKLGLARCGRRDWRARLTEFLDGGFGPGAAPQLVVAAYADWRLAEAPPFAQVCDFAQSRPGNVLLVDTFAKHRDGARHTLLDWLPRVEAVALCRTCRAANVRVALAGALGVAEIKRLQAAQPDWFAVRGAACDDGQRASAVSPEKLRHLFEALRWRAV